jgi:hypothetical protein
MFKYGSKRPAALPHSSIYPYPLFAFPSAGDLAQLNLPVGMQDLILGLTGVTGKTTSVKVTSHMCFKYGFGGQSHALPHSSFYPISSLRLPNCR